MANVAFGLGREDRFSYVCNRCRRCCYGKRIPLTPYDLIRLAESRGIGTGELIREFTEDGVFLRVRDDEPGEPCTFLGPEGCTVHSGRPAACRVYPLGRLFRSSGEEAFSLVEPHPRTAGVYGDSGTIGDYLEQQGLDPFFRAAEAYNAIFESIVDVFSRLRESIPIEGEAPALEAESLLDVDAWVAEYTVRHGLPSPTDAEAKLQLHLAALREWIAAMGQ